MHKFNRSVGRQLGVSGREDDRHFWISLPNFQSKFKSIHPRHGVICHQIRPPATATLLQREQDPKSPFVFTSERGSPFTTAGFARMVERAAVEAKLGFPAHPHMLRHACGFALANKGHDTRALQARPQEHSAHGTLHRIVARSLQGATNQRFRTHHASAPRDRWTARESAPCNKSVDVSQKRPNSSRRDCPACPES